VALERAARGRALAWALVALAAPCAASALSLAELTSAELAPSPRAPLDLFVNGARRGALEAVLRDGDALVPVQDLHEAGLRGFAGSREIVDGRPHVSLASLGPALRYQVDEPGLALRLTARAELLGRAAIDLRPTARPPDLEPAGDASGFLNYSVQLTTDQRTSGFAEAGASHEGRLLYASGQLLADGSAVRGLSSVTFDDADALRRLVVGDAFATTSALGGGALVGGLSIAREFRLDPYAIRAPLPRLSGFASTPSTLEVYVNGVLTREVPLPPGGYDVSNLPVTTGAGNVQTVLKDAFGRSEALSWQYYYTPALLARGLSDYGYSVGFRRLDLGRSSFEYGRPVFLGRHRVGVLDTLTLGGRLDAAEDLLSGGPSATLGLPFGAIDLEAAASVEGGSRDPDAARGRTLGAAASLGYSFVSRRFSGGALVRLLSPRYAHAALRAGDDRGSLQTGVYAGAPVGSRLNLGVSYSLVERRDAGRSDSASARADLLLARNVTLGLSGSRSKSPDGAPVHDVFASLSWAFAPGSVADVAVRSDDRASAGVQRGLPAGTGFGYRARAGLAEAAGEGSGVVQYQWDHGRYELQYDRSSATRVGTATLAGGVVVLGERLFLSRPVQEGYGLIRVGVPGIRGFAEGQEIGRTDARGDLLVPRLLPYYGNRLGIADRDVPVEYRIGRTELLAAPTQRGGVVTRFAVVPLRALEGELVTAAGGGAVPPAYGELTVRASAGSFSSPVGRDGRFYLESVPPGTYEGEVEWSGGRCRVALVVPESPPMADAGLVRCEPPVGEPFPVLVATSTSTAPSPQPSPPAGAGGVGGSGRSAGAGGEGGSGRSAGAGGEGNSAAPAPGALLGFGPPSRRCPSCTICFSAELDLLKADPSLCVPRASLDLERVSPTREEKACLGSADLEEQCSECLRVRRGRNCPTWADQPPALRLLVE
jgi:outer membrane usher protein